MGQLFVVRAAEQTVRTRNADWDESQQAYRFTTEGKIPLALLWLRTYVHTEADDPTFGGLIEQTTPVWQPFTGTESQPADDYIICFPADSVLEPLYLVMYDV